MTQQFESTIFDYLNQIKPGEDLLVEYTSNEPVHLLLDVLFRYLKQTGTPVLVVDVLDHFHMLKTQLELVGVDTKIFEDAYVVKIGGKAIVGNVLGEVHLSEELPIGVNKLHELFKKIPEDFIWRVTLGLDKVLRYHEQRGSLGVFVGHLRQDVGSKDRVRVFAVNRDLVSSGAISEMRELASRVLDVELEKGKVTLTVVKSADFEEYGKKLTVRATELQEYLKEQS